MCPLCTFRLSVHNPEKLRRDGYVNERLEPVAAIPHNQLLQEPHDALLLYEYMVTVGVTQNTPERTTLSTKPSLPGAVHGFGNMDALRAFDSRESVRMRPTHVRYPAFTRRANKMHNAIPGSARS